MQKYDGQLLRKFEIPLEGIAYANVTITVRNYSNNNISLLYSDINGTIPKSNPFVSDSNGYYSFYAPDGKYLINFANGAPTLEITMLETYNPTEKIVESFFAKAVVDLNFATNEHKIYGPFGLELAPLTTAVATARNSTATYQTPTGIASAAINTPRITFDAATGNASGLLAEEQRTNLLLHSQYTGASGETAPTSWVEGGTDTGTTTTAASPRFPSAIRITATGTTQRENIAQIVTLAAATTYTLSCYFAAGTSADNTVMRVTTNDTPTGQITLAASAVTVAGTYSITFTTVAGGNYAFYIGLGCTGNATGTVIHETPQLEAGTAPTNYIPTTTAQMVRFTDVISQALPVTNATAGALYAEVKIMNALPNNFWTEVLRLADSAPTAIRGVGLQFDNDLIRMVVRDSAGTATGIPSLAANPNVVNKILCSFDYTANTALIAINGASKVVSLGASGSLGGFTSNLFIGYSGNVAGGNGTTSSQQIKRCTYVPRSVTAAEAQAITL